MVASEIVKFANKVQQRKDSRSTHPSPLEAKCLECQTYRQWNIKMNGWIACQIGCTEASIKVDCVSCQAVAKFNPQLDQWYCDCKEQKRPVRNRVSTNRFLL